MFWSLGFCSGKQNCGQLRAGGHGFRMFIAESNNLALQQFPLNASSPREVALFEEQIFKHRDRAHPRVGFAAQIRDHALQQPARKSRFSMLPARRGDLRH